MRITNTAAPGAPVMVRIPVPAANPRNVVSVKKSQNQLKSSLEEVDVLTVAEIADVLRVSQATVRQMCKRGVIPARKMLTRYFITRRALMDFIDGKNTDGDNRTTSWRESSTTLSMRNDFRKRYPGGRLLIYKPRRLLF